MQKNRLKYAVDLGMGFSFFLCFFTGLMKWPGKMIGRSNPGCIFTFIHDYSGLLLGFFVLFHLVLNWEWIYAMTKKIFL